MKLTFENHNLFPIWFPDGKRILFITRGRTNYLNAVAADGSSVEPETLATHGEPQVPLTWVPGTDLVLVAQVSAETRQDLELLQMTGRTWGVTGCRRDLTNARRWYRPTAIGSRILRSDGQPEIGVRRSCTPTIRFASRQNGGRRCGVAPETDASCSTSTAREYGRQGRARGWAPQYSESPRQLFEGGLRAGFAAAPFDARPDGPLPQMNRGGSRGFVLSIILAPRNWGHQINELARSK